MSGNAVRGVKVAMVLILLAQIPTAYLVINRLSAGFDTDKNPYEHMHMINRVVEGKPLYAPASPDHYSVTYTPLYWWVTGWLSLVFGETLTFARLVNVLFAAGFLAVVAAFVWKNTERNLYLVLSALGYLLLLDWSDGMPPWLTDANVNAMHCAFVAAGFFLLRGTLTLRRAILSSVCMSLAVLAKHTGLAYLAAGAVYLALFGRKFLVPYLIAAAVLIGIPFAHLQAQSHGEFLTIIGKNSGTPPWMVNRLWEEVYAKHFFGKFGLMALMTLVPLLYAKKGEFWKTLLTPEYFMFGAGLGVASIAVPKIGSGEVHAIIGYTGLAICGSIGVFRLWKAVPGELGGRLFITIPLAQTIVLLAAFGTNYQYDLVDDHDRAKFSEISRVFANGKTCFWGYPYIQKEFGQPLNGYPGDERSVWNNGRMQYNKSDELLRPFAQQDFDYIIMPAFLDQNDPMVQVILKNYQAVGRLPGHPRGPRGGNMRYEYYICRANRIGGSAPQGPGVQ